MPVSRLVIALFIVLGSRAVGLSGLLVGFGGIAMCVIHDNYGVHAWDHL